MSVHEANRNEQSSDPNADQIGGEAQGSNTADRALDLTPRAVEGSDTPRRRRRWLPILVLVGVLVTGGVIITQFLTSAVDYYCNVDEIGTRSGCTVDRRVRVQGIVQQGSIHTQGSVTDFVIEFNGAKLPVAYDGEPGGIFKACLPVVVHGTLDASGTAKNAAGTAVPMLLNGDQVEVKHSNEYVAVNDERLQEATDLELACEGQTA